MVLQGQRNATKVDTPCSAALVWYNFVMYFGLLKLEPACIHRLKARDSPPPSSANARCPVFLSTAIPLVKPYACHFISTEERHEYELLHQNRNEDCCCNTLSVLPAVCAGV